jgi:hypothetical protein
MEKYLFAEFYTIIGMIEEYFDAKRYVLNKERMIHLQKYGFSGLELETENPEIRAILNNEENIGREYDLDILEILGIQLYRRYFFVATYQHFESILIHYCRRVGDKLQLGAFDETKGRSCIDKCKNYLTKAERIEIPPESSWRTVIIYNKLRNCIVHHNALVGSYQVGGTLQKYVESSPLLHFTEIDGEMDDEIFFDKGFCEEAMDFFEMFLEKLDEQVDD